MITQASIEAAYLRAGYGELIRGQGPVVWFGAGAFAHRLAEALTAAQRGGVVAIVDDHASAQARSIKGVPVFPPEQIEPPARIVLATDTLTKTFRERIRSLWGHDPAVIDLLDPPVDAWVHPRDEPGACTPARPALWREALGRAQLELESTGGAVDQATRWIRAHEIRSDPLSPCRYRLGERGRFQREAASFRTGRVVTIAGKKSVRSDPFWDSITREWYTAFSPDGRSAAMVWVRRSEYPVCPFRAGNALWIPDDRHDQAGFTVCFDHGYKVAIQTTRERTYADLSGSAELARYERMASALPAGARVLDCASGTGYGADFLTRHGFRVTGAEIDPDSVAFAQARYPGADYVCACAQRLPFGDDSFDAVVCIETIEHVEDPGAAIAEFARVCKPGGVIGLTTPGVGACDSPFHLGEFTDEDLHDQLDRVLGAGRWASEPLTTDAGWHELLIRPGVCARL